MRVDLNDRQTLEQWAKRELVCPKCACPRWRRLAHANAQCWDCSMTWKPRTYREFVEDQKSSSSPGGSANTSSTVPG